MSLKIELKNLGILKHTEFSLGDLTVICGKNNTGKTYATYALYGFLDSWIKHIHFTVTDAQIQSLLTDGGLKINLAQYVEMADQMLAEACKRYTDELDTVFAASESRFRDSEFHIQTGAIDIRDKEFEHEIGLFPNRPLTYSKKKGSEEVTLALTVEGDQESTISPFFTESAIDFIISTTIFSDFFPTPFISSAERTGAAIFRKELNLPRNRLIEAIGQADHKIDPRSLISEEHPSYPVPIEKSVDFIHRLEDIGKGTSFIAREHPKVLKAFADIIGGEYTIAQNDQLYYTPKGARVRLPMVESSSAVRSLLDIGFYLHHKVRKGSLLMVDEPELNLHPENQRRIARLFARLVNLGIKVFITTHSDYIVKELNTLIMLDHKRPHIEKIATEHGYDRKTESINVNKVKVYTAKEALIPLQKGQKRRRRGHTLVEADIHPELGIRAPSFDDTINKMNRIQSDIVWGAE